MRKSFAAFAFAVFALVQPASAVTFPTLTTIYVGTGVRDNGGADNTGTATVFHCSNVSGVLVNVRFLVLGNSGGVEASVEVFFLHGETRAVSTHFTNAYAESENLATGTVAQGVVNIESTESGVFCTAEIIDAAAASPVGVARHLVRVNPHPGTVE